MIEQYNVKRMQATKPLEQEPTGFYLFIKRFTYSSYIQQHRVDPERQSILCRSHIPCRNQNNEA